MNTVMRLPAWMSGRKKEPTVNSDDERERREWSNNTGQMREGSQWTAEEIRRADDEIRAGLPRINYPRDLDKAPPVLTPQAFLNQRMSERVAPQMREVDAITADLRANEKEISRLQAELSAAGVRDVELRGELSDTLDEIENLAREARKTYKLEAPNAVQPPQARAPIADLRDSPDPGCDPTPTGLVPPGAGASGHDERDQQGGRVAAVPHQERGDDEIPF